MSQLADIESAQKSLEECFTRRMAELEAQIQVSGPAKETVAKVAEEFRCFRELIFNMLGILRRQISECSKLVDSIETRQRKKALLFTGVAETDKEECANVVLGILKSKMALKDISVSSIKVCHRLGEQGRGRDRPILVRFANVDNKLSVWKAKSALKGSPIAVKEFLTKTRQAAFSKARLHFGMRSSWTQEGVIVVKAPDGKRYKITSMDDLKPLLEKFPKEEGVASSSPVRPVSASSSGFSGEPVVMATSDKHCQTVSVRSEKGEVFSEASEYGQAMYDETVAVVNAREIDSPSSDEEQVVRAAMAKFNPPVRHTARHDFDSDSETDSEPEKFLNNVSGEDESPDRKSQPSEKSLDIQKSVSKESSARSKHPSLKRTDSSNSDSDSAELEPERPPIGGSGRKRGGVVIPAEGAYDPKQFQDLKVPPEMENVFQYIMKYTPQKIDIEFKLQPFVPEYVPAVGDIDAFLKVSTPASNVRAAPLPEHVLEHIDNLGLTVLDEPSAEQSDSALLHLQLRAISKTSSAKSTVLTKKIDNAEKNSKAIERWIKDVSELHLSKPAPTVSYSTKTPDIDTLMEEWPEAMEEKLNDVGFPPALLDCTLSQYVDLVCGLFDIPIAGAGLNDRIQALHLLFSLYSAVKNSQLYADRLKEKGDSNM